MNYIRRISACIITLLLIFSLIGCSNAKSSTSTGSLASDVTKISNKAVSIGKIVSITLDENATTGYSWHYSIENSDLIKFDSESTSDSGTTDAKDIKPVTVGAGSKHTWNFKGVKQGGTKITFKYYRSWEGEKTDVKTAEYTIKITE